MSTSSPSISSESDYDSLNSFVGRVDFITSLPLELSNYILQLLDVKSLCQSKLVCKTWYILCTDPSLWRQKFMQDSPWSIKSEYLELLRYSRNQLLSSSMPSSGNEQSQKSTLLPTKQQRPSQTNIRLNKVINSLGKLDISNPNSSLASIRTKLGKTVSSQDLTQEQLQMQAQMHHNDSRPTQDLSLLPQSNRSSSSSYSWVSLNTDNTLNNQYTNNSDPNNAKYLSRNGWLNLYKHQKLLQSRWDSGEHSARYIKGHNDSIYCIKARDNTLITGSRDNTVKVWNLALRQCTQTLEGHTGSVLCLDFDDSLLVTGSSDTNLIVWTNPKNWTIVSTLKAHRKRVLDVCFDNDYIFSSSKEGTICIWDRTSLKLQHKIRGHRGPVNALELHDDQFASASADQTIRIWNKQDAKEQKILTGHQAGIACLSWQRDLIASGANDNTIRVWSTRTWECCFVFNGHTGLIRSLVIDPHPKLNRLISASYDHTIRVWDISEETGHESQNDDNTAGNNNDNDDSRELLEFKNSHSGAIFGLCIDVSRIFTCSESSKILLIDFGDGVDTSPFE